MKNDKEPSFTISRVFDAPRELVFKAWTDPKYVARWWGPGGFTAPFCKIDFRVGGSFLLCMRSPDGTEHWNTGTYKEIVVPEKIVSTMHFCDKNGKLAEASDYGMAGFPSEMLDVITFEALAGDKTRLTILRDHSMELAKRFGEEQGWSTSLEKLARALAGPSPV